MRNKGGISASTEDAQQRRGEDKEKKEENK